MVCSCEFFRCRPRSNCIWAPFTVRRVHPDFHGGHTSLQTYSIRHKFYYYCFCFTYWHKLWSFCHCLSDRGQLHHVCPLFILLLFETRCSRTHYIHHTGLRLRGIHLPINLKCCDYWCEVCVTIMFQTLWVMCFHRALFSQIDTVKPVRWLSR